MNATAPLREAQQEALGYILSARASGISPTPAEVGVAIGRPGSIAVVLTGLAQRGWITHPGIDGEIVPLRDLRGNPLRAAETN